MITPAKSARLRRRPPQMQAARNDRAVLEASEVSRGGEDFLSVGEEGFLERGGVGNGRVERSDAHEGAIKIMEGFFEKDGGNFRGDATGFGVFVDHKTFVGFLDGGKDGFLVERHEG